MSEALPDVVLETARLMIRAFTPADAGPLAAGVNDEECRRWLPVPAPYPAERAAAWVAGPAHRLRLTGAGYHLAVCRRADGRLLGGCTVTRVVPGGAELEGWLAPWARGQGYATEALAFLANWAAEEYGRAQYAVAADNLPGQRVAVAAGLRREAVLRAAATNPERADALGELVVYGRLPGEPPAVPLLPWARPMSDGQVAIRPVRPGDATRLREQLNDPAFQIRGSGPAAETDVATAAARIHGQLKGWLAGERASFAIADPVTDAFAGTITLYMTGPGRGMIGMGVHPAYRGRGWAARAVRLLARWAFEVVGLARLEAGVEPDNAPSIRSLERGGLRREGLLRGELEPLAAGGPRRDVYLYALVNPALA
ncbi:MAG: GNAT family N-acetyltransferase [Mycobacteriales bacterium]